MIGGNSGELVIYAFLLGFFRPSRHKKWYWKLENVLKTQELFRTPIKNYG